MSAELEGDANRSDDTIRRALGMLPDKPMAECSECGHWSYLAAIEGVCLQCSMDRGLTGNTFGRGFAS